MTDSKKTINRSDITQETYLVWKCPDCDSVTDVFDDGEVSYMAVCEHCDAEFEILED